jgi:hypothetical protein
MAKGQLVFVDSAMVERKAPAAAPVRPPQAEEAASLEPTPRETQAGCPLNFRVTAAFRREFRMYAADRGLRLNEVLVAAFRALEQQTKK